MFANGESRLILGTAQYPSPQILEDSIIKSGVDIITVSLRRQLPSKNKNIFWEMLCALDVKILPNTAGCFTTKEAVATAEMARELFETNWIKVEVIGDDYTLQPNPIELIKATKVLINKGFEVFPYCTDDLILCKELVNCGCDVLMPLASPIGTGKGILNPYALSLLRDRFPETTIIVDAGIGKPSHAVCAMELGVDAVLLNTAVALADDPAKMAESFSLAVQSGRLAYESGLMLERNVAHASTPLVGRPFMNEVRNES